MVLGGCGGSAFREAARVDTVASYERFLTEFHDGRYAKRARQRLEELGFAEARLKNTPDGYAEFIQRFPMSRFVAEANAYLVAAEVAEAMSFDRMYESPVTGPEVNEASRVAIANRTETEIEMLYVFNGIHRIRIDPGTTHEVLIGNQTVVVFKDAAKSVKPVSLRVVSAGAGQAFDLWLVPDERYRKKLEITPSASSHAAGDRLVPTR
jgi:hypothetical protein